MYFVKQNTCRKWKTNIVSCYHHCWKWLKIAKTKLEKKILVFFLHNEKNKCHTNTNKQIIWWNKLPNERKKTCNNFFFFVLFSFGKPTHLIQLKQEVHTQIDYIVVVGLIHSQKWKKIMLIFCFQKSLRGKHFCEIIKHELSK